MNISYNWLKNYLNTDLLPNQIAEILTDIGLEVGSIEKIENIKGGLEGLVVGEVLTKQKHPNADKLNLAGVDIGQENCLPIVCGASNLEIGQKVVVATVNTTLYPIDGEPFTIKKSKIRGEVSEGMICAEDEIGIGNSHEGIIVLPKETKTGISVKDVFNVETDSIFEVDLTPNRIDAASHFGIARDLYAAITTLSNTKSQGLKLMKPSVDEFQTTVINNQKFNVQVNDSTLCPRYSGILIDGITVSKSPKWLESKLKAIGVKSINNIVDITNYILHETGHPLHAFDAEKIEGNQVVVRTATAGEKFTTLDGVERTLSSEDLMICDSQKPMCIAGVFGGKYSGVSENTTSIFLESAYFQSTGIRKTARRHGLNTDASYRYERGADPNICIYALKRATLLIQEVAGGKCASVIFDHYPTPIAPVELKLNIDTCAKVIGKRLEPSLIKQILTALEISILSESKEELLLSIPTFKVDVQREIDVIEEILRIYGYNHIELPTLLKSSLSYSTKPDKEQIKNKISDHLCSLGFSETMSNSLSNSKHYIDSKLFDNNKLINVLNPVSSDLDVLRQTLLFNTLENISFNINRKNNDLKFFEFGTVYSLDTEKNSDKFIENPQLSLALTGNTNPENWKHKSIAVDFYDLKGVIESILTKLGITSDLLIFNENTDNTFQFGLNSFIGKNRLITFGLLSKKILTQFDIKQEVYFADFAWDNVLNVIQNNKLKFVPLSKFPSVKRDLALLVDDNIKYLEIEKLAFSINNTLLKKVNLFDVYKGKGIEQGKKSYALSFYFQDEKQTLTDEKVENIMKKIIKKSEETFSAVLR